MKQDSLFKALDLIIKALDKTDIDNVNKVELMLNLRRFLVDYNENIEILRRNLWK